MISIVVPIYNASGLVARCIDSVLAQTFTDWELVIVDDGSTDDSLQVCTAYAEKDNRISVYHKENGGQTSARRFGFEHSQGDYIYFVDADDFLPNEALKLLHDKAVEENLDIVDGASISYFEDFSVKENVRFADVGVFEKLPYLELMFANKANNGTHACLIHRRLFGDETFNIPEEVRLGEDAYIHLCLVMRGKRFGIYDDIVYYYVQNRDSITHYYRYTSIRPLESQIESIRRVLDGNGLFSNFSTTFYFRAITSLSTACFNNRKLLGDPYLRRISNEALKNNPSLYVRLLCYFLKYPTLYYFFYGVNSLRRLLSRSKY